MTTLPQVSGSRLPRPNGNIPTIAVPHLPSAGHAPAAAGGGLTVADIIRVLRSNALLIIISMTVTLTAGYFFNSYLSKNHSRFTATGYIKVDQPIYVNPITGATDASTDFSGLAIEMRTNATLLRNDALISRILQDPNSDILQTGWFKQFIGPVAQLDGSVKTMPNIGSAKRELLAGLSAAPVPESKLIAVSFSYSNPADCRRVVEEVIKKFLDEQRLLASSRTLDRSTMLTVLLTSIKDRIKRLGEENRSLIAKLSIEGGTPGRISSIEVELNNLVLQRIAAAEDLNAAKTNSETIMTQMEQGMDPSMVEQMANSDDQVKAMKSEVDRYDIQIESSRAISTEARVIKSLEAQRDATQKKLNQITDETKTHARLSIRDGLQTQVKQYQSKVDAMDKQIEVLKSQLGELAVLQSDYLSNSDELETARQHKKSVEDQLEAIRSRTPGGSSSVDWAQHPETPDSPTFPKLASTLTMAGLIGAAFSLGIAFLREMMDNTIRSPRDIARVGQLNLLGMIPHESDDPQSAGAPLPLVIYQAPTSIMAEQFRQVRTRLQHAASLDTTRSLLITSPSPQDGKSVIACNIAAGLALNGRRILLVDANFKRPELHKTFALDNSTGFGDVLTNLENFDSAVQRTSVPNLDLLTTGPKPGNPTELLESQLLTDFIERALEVYDHVIFDSGPLLLVSETVALAPRVDGVVTVVRAAANSRGLLTRLRDTLRQVKAEHLGVILNGVRSQGGGYYGRNIKTYYAYQNGN